MAIHRKNLAGFILLLVLSATVNATSITAFTQTLRGHVQSGDLPLPGYRVSLHAKYLHPFEGLRTLGSATTDSLGNFEINYWQPYWLPDDLLPILFITATEGPSMLASALGKPPILNDVVVNERTTVAASFAFAQFIGTNSKNDNKYGLLNAVHMAGNMANTETGAVGDVLGSPPNGPDTTTLETFNSLANIVAYCVESAIGCAELFEATTPAGGQQPQNVLMAVANIAKFPWLNPEILYALSLQRRIYSPARTLPPDAWALFLKFTGTRSSEQTSNDLMNGPGAFAIDKQGFIWVNDNFVPQSRFDVACAGLRLLKFYPWGENFPGSPYYGGGLSGAGFGITLAPNGHVWVGNFGFEAPECSVLGNPYANPATHDSVSEFLPNGVARSPDDQGYTEGNIFWPQATVADRDSNIWIANCGNDTVTVYPKGKPSLAFNVSDIGLDKPFGLAIDGIGNAWVTGNRSDTVAVIGPAGNLIEILDGNFSKPMGIAADSRGNMWISNSDLIDVPCPPPADDFGNGTNPSIALFQADRQPYPGSPFHGGGLIIPWGNAVDGNDTIWVANFGINPEYNDPDSIIPGGLLPRVSQFCGMDVSKCPPGKQQTGMPISPETGYTTNALNRNTGIAIDPSGNVWLANNYKEIPPRINPGGNSITVMVGAAGPLRTPLIGLPRSFNH